MKRILPLMLAALCALLPVLVLAEGNTTTITTSVPTTHTITVVCGEHGKVTIGGVTCSGTFAISVERLGTLTITAQPDRGYTLSQVRFEDMDGVTVKGREITLTGIHRDNTVTLTFTKAPAGTVPLPTTPPATVPGDAPLDGGVTLPEITATGNTLYDDFLGTGSGLSQLGIVFDGEYAPRDYELLNVKPDREETENTILVRAFPEEDGEFGRRSLILSVTQLIKLAQKQRTQYLIFENGDAALAVSMGELMDGDVRKMISLIVSGDDPISTETLDADWSRVKLLPLTAAELEPIDVEIRIIPMGDGEYDISVWLRWDGQEAEISDLLPSAYVCLNIGEEDADGCTVGYRAEEEEDYLPLDSESVWLPAEMPEDHPDVGEKFIVTMPDSPGDDPITAYDASAPLPLERHSALAAGYAGRGSYRPLSD